MLHNPVSLIIIVIIILILGLVTVILISIVTFLKLRIRKELTYEVVSNTKIVGLEAQPENELRIVFQGILISDPSIVILKLINTGNGSIKPDDFFHTSLEINFGTDAKVYYCGVREAEPKILERDLLSRIHIGEGKVLIEPFLFNKNNSVKFQILLSNFTKEIDVRAMILGCEIKQVTAKRDLRAAIYIIPIVAIASLTAISIVAAIANNSVLVTSMTLLVAIIAVVIAFIQWAFPLPKPLYNLINRSR